MMGVQIRSVAATDWKSITAIFNHHVVESLAAYPEQPVGEAFFRDRHEAAPDFPFFVAETEDGRVVGFAYLSPFHPVATMKQSATVTYFLDPEWTGRGIGTIFLDRLLQEGRGQGITNVLAHISSENPGSIRFHLKHGFTECGRFVAVGVKNGHPFDMVWMQRLVVPDADRETL